MFPAVPPAFGRRQPPTDSDGEHPSLPAASETLLAAGYPMITVDGR